MSVWCIFNLVCLEIFGHHYVDHEGIDEMRNLHGTLMRSLQMQLLIQLVQVNALLHYWFTCLT